MKWLGIILAILAALVLLMIVIGALLPVKHVARRAARFQEPPAIVWAVITGIDTFPSWRPGVKRIERMPDRDGLPVWAEYADVGPRAQKLTLKVLSSNPPSGTGSGGWVTRLASPNLPFGGTWTYEIQPNGSGSTLRITENGEVYNPFFRFMSRFVFGHRSSIDAYLKALGQKLGEAVTLED